MESSLPSRERGLKLYQIPLKHHRYCVAPLAGAWIEILLVAAATFFANVAPLAGAWIEILYELTEAWR